MILSESKNGKSYLGNVPKIIRTCRNDAGEVLTLTN